MSDQQAAIVTGASRGIATISSKKNFIDLYAIFTHPDIEGVDAWCGDIDGCSHPIHSGIAPVPSTAYAGLYPVTAC